RHHPVPVPEVDPLAHRPTLHAKRAVYTARQGLRQRKRRPYTSSDARHSETRPVHAAGAVLASGGAGRGNPPGSARPPPPGRPPPGGSPLHISCGPPPP